MKKQLLIIGFLLTLFGCNKSLNVEAETNTESRETLQGIVIHKPWTKSLESWQAGGSDYFVLDTGDNPVKVKTAEEGVILKPTEEVTEDILSNYKGQSVIVTGEYKEHQPVTPDPMSQYPTDFNGDPLPRGGGFAVFTIEAME